MKEKIYKHDKTKKKRVQGFQVVEDKCIWMKAGVVNFRLCDNAYDCNNCPFDHGMSKTMNLESKPEAKKESPGWVQYLRERYHGSSRPCRHALTGRIDAPKICVLNYECYHCAYDQLLDEDDFVRLMGEPIYKKVSGFRIAEGYYYHMGHSWARFEHGGLVRIGFDDFIVKLFGDIKELNLPPLGATLKQNEVGWTFGRNGNKAAVLSPVTGTLLTINYRAIEHPEITNHDPYQSGWLFILEPDLPKRNLKRLYFEKECFRWIEQESKKLMGLIGPEYEQLAATGGEVINDIYGNIPDLGWDRLVDTFLHTEKI
ncbi:glycine cleavage system protein H [Thermodesulfobacteriota bacterium]